MVQPSTAQKTQTDRAIDPNVLQRQASTPERSVWVGASAGSGKTKVLTDRMVRLLLPDKKGAAGTPPHKILALTFTKAGANEMALRIAKRLSDWVVMPLEGDNGLQENLKNLLGYFPTEKQIEEARKIFAAVVDAPGGLKIMTIHSFCQSILGRFPLEAGLPPNFKALEESEAQSLLNQALRSVIKKSEDEKASPLTHAIFHLTQTNNEEQFQKLIENLISERHQMKRILEKNFGVEGLYTALCQNLEITAGLNTKDFLKENFADTKIRKNELRQACKALLESSKKTDNERGKIIEQWIEIPEEERIDFYPFYKLAYLTTENECRKSLTTKEVENKSPDIVTILAQEAEHIQAMETTLKSIQIAEATRDLFYVGEAVLENYNILKKNKNSLDFDDLILTTLDLLEGKTPRMNEIKDVTPWVRFKMDQGVDHILIDEAQDTNPEQWGIIQLLCDDFFDGENETNRSVFIVGDEKQSIFSFQRASPEKFHEMQKWFAKKINNKNDKLEKIDFITSFRSAPAVLSLVDATFSQENLRRDLSNIPLKHEAHRNTQAGYVELWPLFESPKKQNEDPWTPPTEIIESKSGAAQMATHIGETIAKWIKEGEKLESYDRPIKAGDIMILVRSRTAFIDQLVRSLKTRNIPVSGVDRMVLSNQLVAQDLCALAQFALLPDDDLTLATILKSPLIGWNEEQLYDIAYKRQSSLWDSLKEKTQDKDLISWLSMWIEQAGKMRPFDFFMSVLQRPCPADSMTGLHAIKKRLGEECLDPLNEFLNAALKFDMQDISTLQSFIQRQLYDDSQIKRQMEENSDSVRIMTVHGAKGLQAPIVILPDTTRTASALKTNKIFWPDRSHKDYPYYCPQSKNLPAPCEEAKLTLREREDEEYRRLLYVALTRAENRLYVGGYKATKPIIPESWYEYVKNGFSQLAETQTRQTDWGEILIYKNPQTDKPDRPEKADEKSEISSAECPYWLFKPMPEEPFPPHPLVPSRPSEPDMPALSPLKSTQDGRFKRGNITHKLLQILPDLPESARKQAAENYVAEPAHHLSKDVQHSIVSEVMQILQNPEFAPIFGSRSVAEAPITGLLDNGRLVCGQIDRLCITDDAVLIIDYKSNRPAPKEAKDVPKVYFNQMQAYADVMRAIYPKHTIKCALLWTDGCQLMNIDVS
ncbi:MAG: double-strand break repair helicase AddA [Alphaproteobacteria bacterium]|nr:double-strand break repair helicase AddA [Alphaproteobacteria bacterium]